MIVATPPPVPPVVYSAGAPCRTVRLSATFEVDGRTYRLTRISWCRGGKTTFYAKAVK